jgi:hypothetical protein
MVLMEENRLVDSVIPRVSAQPLSVLPLGSGISQVVIYLALSWVVHVFVLFLPIPEHDDTVESISGDNHGCREYHIECGSGGGGGSIATDWVPYKINYSVKY